MSDEGYRKRMKELIEADVESALDVHMEVRMDRDKERDANKQLRHKEELVEINIRTALRAARRSINLEKMADMYEFIIDDLFENDRERYENYMEVLGKLGGMQ